MQILTKCFVIETQNSLFIVITFTIICLAAASINIRLDMCFSNTLESE